MTDWSVDFTDNETRRWQDARRYGFIAAGGAPRYRTAMEKLQIGDRIFVKIPRLYRGKGYIGVGVVAAEAVPISQFTVPLGGREISILDPQTSLAATEMERDRNDENLCEWLARVDWRAVCEPDQAFWDPRFGAQIHKRSTVYALPAWACSILLRQFNLPD